MITTKRKISIPPPLFPHQTEAVEKLQTWEKTPFHSVVGGILAFKMGLGKTRTCLELVFKTKIPQNPTLVVCNKSNIQVWVEDIKRFYKYRLSYFILHSEYCNPSNVTKEEIEKYDIIITTYEIVRKFFNESNPKCFSIKENNFRPEEPGLYRKPDIPDTFKIVDIQKPDITQCRVPSIIYSRKWRRIISDESQKFVNTSSGLFQSMVTLVGESYLCLSGTPIVNYNTDMYSLFRFMGFKCRRNEWSKNLYDSLSLVNRVLIKDYKDTTITLPNIKIKNEFIDLNNYEKKMYNEIIQMLKEAMNKFLMGGCEFAAPLAMFVRLRQICCCPNILMNPTAESQKEIKKLETILNIIKTNNHINMDDISKMFGCTDHKNEDDGDDECPYPFLNKNLYQLLEVSPKANEIQIKQGYRNMCLLYHPDKNLEHPEKSAFIFRWVKYAYEVLYDKIRRRNYDTHRLSIYKLRDEPDAPIIRDEDLNYFHEPLSIVTIQSIINAENTETSTPVTRLINHITEQIESMKYPNFFTTPELNEYARDPNNIHKAGKVKKIKEIIDAHPNSKILIFSSFVAFLEVLIKEVDEESMLLNGKVNTQTRQDMINYFNKNDTPRLFFSSFKCGGVGLNLTVADVVIICEPWWNPSTEEQAIARSHRVGQTKDVTVYNLIIHPSFEEYLIFVQEKKRKISQDYLGNSDSRYSRMDNISMKHIIEHILSGAGRDVKKHHINLL